MSCHFKIMYTLHLLRQKKQRTTCREVTTPFSKAEFEGQEAYSIPTFLKNVISMKRVFKLCKHRSVAYFQDVVCAPHLLQVRLQSAYAC
mmetsp:Transcript_5575/g.15012  ORF Transcript_5575/g.15012 Transcript_5575/m.15012 type:complete len:89 (+) Transcript_5575:726-992(+)